MHKRITFRGMEHSGFVEQYAEKQLARIIKFLENEPTPIYLDLVMDAESYPPHYIVELLVKTPHYNKISKFEGYNFNDVIDRVIDVMYQELHEEKRKLIDKRNHPRNNNK